MSTAAETWQPGEPLYDRQADIPQSVGWARRMADVIDDLENCRDGICAFCSGIDVSAWSTVMVVKFGGAA